jgi:hypothetical protein
MMLDEVALAWFEPLSRNLSGRIEENHEGYQSE